MAGGSWMTGRTMGLDTLLQDQVSGKAARVG